MGQKKTTVVSLYCSICLCTLQQTGEEESDVETVTKETDGSNSLCAVSSDVLPVQPMSTPMSTPCGNPRRKRKCVEETGDTATLKNANSIMEVVAQKLKEPPPKTNATRHFCDMLYQQLMTFPEAERELVQYEMHGVIMQHKHQLRTHAETEPTMNDWWATDGAATYFSL